MLYNQHILIAWNKLLTHYFSFKNSKNFCILLRSNIYSIIGLVLLIGLVAKNSILLIDLTNQRRSQGLTIAEALKDACPTRLRPVLMTSLTVILSMTPAAMGYGPGADRNGPLSVAVIGGMITSTLLTLVVVPVVYSLIENAILRLQGRKLASAIAQVDYVN